MLLDIDFAYNSLMKGYVTVIILKLIMIAIKFPLSLSRYTITVT
jgi:hypothetical protein